MKKLIALTIVAILFTNCRFSNNAGKCVGLMSDKKPELEYEFSVRNGIWTFIGGASIVVPAIWAMYALECPVETE